MDGYLDALADRVLVFDGAMGTELMALELGDADFGGELIRARWGEMTVRIAPFSRELPAAARER